MSAKFPAMRFRRRRGSAAIRRLTRETDLSPSHLIQPLFVKEGLKRPVLISSLPGQYQHTQASLLDMARACMEARLGGILLFAIPAVKTADGREAWNPKGVLQTSVRRIKKEFPHLLVLTDVCLCEYTSHGHCGLIHAGKVRNDATLPLLARVAVSHARAGADVVAPSDMMDGRVAAIRAGLDRAGFEDMPILSYAVKHASAFYGPFRVAAENKPSFGDRRTYQMDPANAREAIAEALADEGEGADFLMVKPGLPALDILTRLKSATRRPLGAYQVSGEYAMIKAAAANGWVDGWACLKESLIALRRGGADFVLTYGALEAAAALRQKKDEDQ